MVARPLALFATALVPGAALLCGGARSAAADGYSLHVIGHAQSGWTDNLLSHPKEEDRPVTRPDLEDPKEDFFTTVTPGILFTYDAHRQIHEVFYELAATFYAEHSEAWNLLHRGGWRAQFMMSPRTEVGASATVAGGVLNSLPTLTLATDGTVQPMPSAESRFGSVEGRELLTHQWSRDWRLMQDATVRMFSTSWTNDEGMSFGSTGYELAVGGGAERAWQFTAVGAQAQAAVVHLGEIDQMMVRGLLSWRRDVSERWSSVVDGGVVALVPFGGDRPATAEPTIGAQVGYYPEWGSAGLALRRTVAPNLAIGANTITDMATINAYLPLPWFRDRLLQPRLTFGTSIGYAATTALDHRNEPISSYDNLLIDLALGWRIGAQMELAARYQHLEQHADNDALINVFTYTRNTVLVTFGMRWPERVAAEVPNRETLRVHRQDPASGGDPATDPTGGGRR